MYSISEARLNMMRSFKNGTFRTDPDDPLLPPRNKQRVPMFNNPTPHVLKILSPERILRECSWVLGWDKMGELGCYVSVPEYVWGRACLLALWVDKREMK